MKPPLFALSHLWPSRVGNAVPAVYHRDYCSSAVGYWCRVGFGGLIFMFVWVWRVEGLKGWGWLRCGWGVVEGQGVLRRWWAGGEKFMRCLLGVYEKKIVHWDRGCGTWFHEVKRELKRRNLQAAYTTKHSHFKHTSVARTIQKETSTLKPIRLEYEPWQDAYQKEIVYTITHRPGIQTRRSVNCSIAGLNRHSSIPKADGKKHRRSG